MKNSDETEPNLDVHCQRVEKLLKFKEVSTVAQILEADPIKLIHELEVHQMELEMQNQELLLAKSAARDAIDLYDLAPIGYFTLNQVGEIIRLNLLGAEMLGKERNLLINSRFGFFVSDETKPAFNFFLEKTFKSNTKETCELTLVINNNSPVYVLLTSLASKHKDHCLVTAVDITERRQQEMKMQYFALLLENVNDSIVASDAQFRLTLWNKSAELMYGWKADEVLGRLGLEITQTIFTEGDKNNILKSIAATGHFRGEATQVRRNGERFPVDVSSIVLRDDNGQISGYVSINRDITKQKKNEEALKQSEARFRSYFELPFTGRAITSPDKGWTEVNDTLCNMLGYSRDELLQKTWAEITHPDDISEDFKHFSLVMKGETDGYTLEKRFIHKDGHVVHTHLAVQCLRLPDHSVDYFVAVIIDITDRKRAEEAVKLSEEKYRTLFENSIMSIIIIDINGVYLMLNNVAANQFGLQPEEIVGKSLFDLLPHDVAQKYLKSNQALISTGGNREYEDTFLMNGEQKTYLIFDRCLNNEKGDGYAIQSISVDITRRKLAEQEIKIKNEELHLLNAQKDKFFSIIAHDLKSPFNSIVGFSSLLVDKVNENDINGIGKYAEIILQSSERALELLMNLMDWARSQTGRMEFNPEYFEIVRLIDDVADFFDDIAGHKKITLTRNLPTGNPVFADKAMISTILRNLLSNAVKFTRPGGEIIISANEKSGELIVSVADNGVGIPKDKIEKLFRLDESYSTTGTNNEKGTGLGLILCKEFIEKHEGKIWVESKAGNGSVFSFSLPLNNEL